jgi:hypothetical protein
MKEWKKPEVLDLRIALTAGAAKHKRPNHSSHVLPTPIPQITPIEDESDIML